MPTVHELNETRKSLVKESRIHLEEANAAGRWNQEDENKWTALQERINALKTEIDSGVAAENRLQLIEQQRLEAEAEAKRIVNDPTGLRQQFAGTTIPLLPQQSAGFDQSIPDAEARSLAMDAWFMSSRLSKRGRAQVTDRHRQAAKQCGVNLSGKEMTFSLLPKPVHEQLRNSTQFAWNPMSQRYQTLSSLIGSQGGVLVPETAVNKFERALLSFGGMLQVAETITTAGANKMPWPHGNDTGNKGRRLNQSEAVNNAQTYISEPTFGGMVMYAYKYTSDEILIPFELLRDSDFDLASLIMDMLAERVARAQNDDWTSGTGTDQPYGIVTRASTGKTTATATAIKWDETLDLLYSLDPAYRGNRGVGYMAHDGIFTYLRKLKDADAKYYWQPAATAGEPDTMNGYPTYRNQSMQSTVAASTTTMLFGDFSFYKIRRVGKVRVKRLDERYADNDQVAFLAFVESDGNLLDAGTHPVKAMVQHS